MSFVNIQNEFHVALNGVGLLLQGAPNAPAYQSSQAPLYNARFGQGDRSYSDFSFWWFWAQTSFSGYKQDAAWEDDGYFFESEGVDIFKDNGSFSLSQSLATNNTIAKLMYFHAYGEAAGTGILVGINVTDQKASARSTTGTVIYEDPTVGGGESYNCTGEMGDGILYIGCNTKGAGASRLKTLTSGGAIADVGTYDTSNIVNIVPYYTGDALFVFTASDGIYSVARATGTFTQKKTTYPCAVEAVNFSFGLIVGGPGAVLVGDKIYFLFTKLNGFTSQLWAYDITANSYIEIFRFDHGTLMTRIGMFNNNVYMFCVDQRKKRGQIWKYTTSTGVVERIHEIGRGLTSTPAVIGTFARDSDFLYFAYDDATSDYQIWKLDSEDNIASTITPPSQFTASTFLLATTSGGLPLVAKDGASNANRIALGSGSGFLTTGYLITSVFDGNIGALDKLYGDATINFAPLASGQSIEVLYSIDEGITFTSLGTASFAVEGAASSKKFIFGSAIVSKKLMLKFILTGGGTDTPVVNDFSVRYVPFVNYTKQWQLRVNIGNDVKRLNGSLVQTVARELKGMLETAWWTKSILDYQDLDYATTTLNGSLTTSTATITVVTTAGFPERGRLQIDNEQILYTGKTATTFTGLTRGARETKAAAHLDTTVVNNAYKVIISDFGYVPPILLEGRNLEYIVTLNLREI